MLGKNAVGTRLLAVAVKLIGKCKKGKKESEVLFIRWRAAKKKDGSQGVQSQAVKNISFVYNKNRPRLQKKQSKPAVHLYIISACRKVLTQ